MLSREFLEIENDLRNKNPFIRAIKGNVQAGKTRIVIDTALYFMPKYTPVIILRNSSADAEQLIARFEATDPKCKCLKITKKENFAKNTIYIALGNQASISYLQDTIMGKFLLFIDEVDLVYDPQQEEKFEIINNLIKRASGTFGISATILDFLSLENCGHFDLINIKPPANYYGVKDIQYQHLEIDCAYLGKLGDSMISYDPLLIDFHRQMIDQPSLDVENYDYPFPRICLVSTCRTKQPMFEFQDLITYQFENITTLVYTGEGIRYKQGDTVRYLSSGIASVLSQLRHENEKSFRKNGILKHSHIFIYAGGMASRGISFVDQEYIYHLTEMRLLVSNDCNEANLLQKIRLCGVYNYVTPLTLYTTRQIHADILSAFDRVEELTQRVKKEKKSLMKIKYSQHKLTKRSIFHSPMFTNKMLNLTLDDDGGWEVNKEHEYDHVFLIETEKLETKKNKYALMVRELMPLFEQNENGEEKKGGISHNRGYAMKNIQIKLNKRLQKLDSSNELKGQSFTKGRFISNLSLFAVNHAGKMVSDVTHSGLVIYYFKKNWYLRFND